MQPLSQMEFGHCDVGYYSCTGTRRCCPDGYDCTGTDKCEKGYCDVGYYSCTGTRWCCPDGYDCTGTDQCDEKRGYLFWLLIGAPILVFAIAGSIVICYRGYRDRPRKTDLPSTACSGFLQSNISSSRGRLIEQ
ncbi:uncharacterized protein LOC134711135 [Mytilus trossulus]|uniref:uncharacterized protein LOC134711135 n=1 Tax=Mytilus trossulus TaxID=6551 RepID=UPI0030058069